MLGAVFQVKGVDKGGHGIEREDIAEDLAQLVHPQEGEIKPKKVDLPGRPHIQLGDQVEGNGRQEDDVGVFASFP